MLLLERVVPLTNTKGVSIALRLQTLHSAYARLVRTSRVPCCRKSADASCRQSRQGSPGLLNLVVGVEPTTPYYSRRRRRLAGRCPLLGNGKFIYVTNSNNEPICEIRNVPTAVDRTVSSTKILGFFVKKVPIGIKRENIGIAL
jgi:hypothetical protein